MPIISFVEVDAEDESYIREKFPDARIFSDTLDHVLDQCKESEVLSIFVYSSITKEVLDALPNLKLICSRSVGYDHIDLEECRKRNVTVCHVPDYGSHVIAEHVFALLLSTLRHIHKADERVEQGEFDYHGLRGVALKGKVLGVVGTGKIGTAVCKIAHGFGMHIVACDVCRRSELEEQFGVRYVEYEQLLKESDIITLHVPAIAETEHMINTAAFERMKDGSILINTARGSVIDSNALLTALQSGKVSHALLDVLEHEENFEENRALIEHPNVVSTPHIAFYADDSMRNMYDDAFMSIEEWKRGEEPEHIVRPPDIVCDMSGASSLGA